MRYPTFLSFVVISTWACGDDAGTKGVFVPHDAAVNSQTDAGVDTSTDTLGCDLPDKVCPLTCEVLANPSFCWNVARIEANACGSSATIGTMSPDGLSCTSPDSVVSFDAPVLIDEVLDREAWRFEVARDGITCLGLDDGPLSLALETSSGRVSVQFTLQPEFYRIECPNGSAWEAFDQMALLACKDADGFTSLPGISKTTIGDEFQFGILPGPENLLWCRF